jgi:rSAM/selenodomain-associated transferase 1
MSTAGKHCIVLFVKYPSAGRVKTRLAQIIGPHNAARMYEHFVHDIIGAVRTVAAPVWIFFDPPHQKKQFQNWLGNNFSYAAQSGVDLGQKMKNAFQHVFAAGFSEALLMGSDIPDLPVEHLERGLKALQADKVVVGPAGDGGYYLIGFTEHNFLPEVFENIRWGTDTVYEQTLNTLRKRRRKAFQLPRWNDVDTAEDLKEMLSRNQSTDFGRSGTIRYASKLWSAVDVRL